MLLLASVRNASTALGRDALRVHAVDVNTGEHIHIDAVRNLGPEPLPA
jgi:hypothetical protein